MKNMATAGVLVLVALGLQGCMTTPINMGALNRVIYPEAEPSANRNYPKALPLRVVSHRHTNACPPRAGQSRQQVQVRGVATRNVASRQQQQAQYQQHAMRQQHNAQQTMQRLPPAQANAQLFAAAKGGNPQQIANLIQQGANPNYRNSNGETALHAAATVGQTANIQQLMSAGANPNATTIQGWTPLHSAARFGRVGAVQVLLRNGANPSMRNRQGKTPGELARQVNQNGIAGMLGG